MRLCILGRGKLGSSLHAALAAQGIEVRLARGRGRFVAGDADTFLLAVPDARIREVAARLAPGLPRGSVVLHCAGARGPDELEAARQAGAHVAAFHPLVSFATKRTALTQATFVIHGDRKATQRARTLAKLLGARAIAAPVLGPSYHAAAALVANGAVALSHAGVDILRALGVSQRDAERALAGLLHSVASNITLKGVPLALTGPVSRGDADTIARHLAALKELTPELAESYARVLPLVLRTARAQGLAPDRAAAVSSAISRGSRRRPTPESARPSRTRPTRAKAQR